MNDKEGIIETYVNMFCDTYNQFSKRESLLRVWKEMFDYLDKEEYIVNFIKACKSILNDSTWRKMPSPGDVKDKIREMLSGKKESGLGKQPYCRPEFMKLVTESRLILKEKERVADMNKKQELMLKYWDVVQKMCTMSKTPFKFARR